VPRGVLHQIRCRRHGVLQGARGRQALPDGGLLQVRSRRHGTLVMNLQFSILMAQTTDTAHCVAHGGGRRCQHEGCLKSARGGTLHCQAHGGGRRCQTVDCPKSALADTGHCSAHSGGRRCQHEGCSKAAVAGGTPH
jgi:hypothetical protein